MPDYRALNVFRDQQLVGTLFDESPLRFRYAEEWLHRPDAQPIAPMLDLGHPEHSGDAVFAFFENLLPEGERGSLARLYSSAASSAE